MWDEAEVLGLDCVEKMSDEQYDVALRSVHKYYVDHPAQRKMWALEEDHGPVNVSERHTDKAMYTSGTRMYKFFSYKVFCIELQGLQRDITPQTASERQFMEALRLTSHHLSNHLVIRNLPHTLCFRGPQSVAHRLDFKRLMFDPREVHPKGFRSASKHKGVFPSLMCSDCAKWRRVDDETLLAFSNETFSTIAWPSWSRNSWKRTMVL